MAKQKVYPDVSHLLASHEAFRRKLALLTWEEKVAIMERMRDDLSQWHEHGAGPDKHTRKRKPDGRMRKP